MTLSLSDLAARAEECQNCPLHRSATQTVFGEGPATARMMLVGEQPGDVEDRRGEVFVGPAGLLLDRALADASVDRSSLYLTNAVKHFKWTPRGKRRLHQTPNRDEVEACRPWLEQEIAVIRPELIVAMGATAAGALLGPKVRVTRDRGTFHDLEGIGRVMPTVHPSSVLRADEEQREVAYRAFVDDLALAAARLAGADRPTARQEELSTMATTKQRQAAKGNIRKAISTASTEKTISHLPAKTRTALGKQGAAVAARHRSGGSEPKTKAELYAEAKRRNIPGRSKMGRAQLASALHER
jgi:DNA polymerase